MKPLIKRIERSGRHLSGRTLGRMLASNLSSAGLPDPPASILVVRPDSRLGNLVLLEPLLRGLRTRFPDSDLDILASHVFSGVLESQGYSVIRVDKKGQIGRPWEFAELAGKLSSAGYDVVIDASHPHAFSLSGVMTCAITGSRYRIGTSVSGSADWYSHTVPVPSTAVHESAALHGLGALWEGWPVWTPPMLHTVESIPPRDAVGLHVGASGRKAFPIAYLDRLAGMLCRSACVEVYWSGEKERETARQLRARHPLRMMPEMPVTGLMESLSGLRGLITADNGPMHAASALGVPVVGLFRVDNACRFAPLSRGSQVLLDPDAELPGEASELLLQAAFD